MTKPRENHEELQAEIEDGKRKSGSLRTGKSAGKSCRKRNAGHAATPYCPRRSLESTVCRKQKNSDERRVAAALLRFALTMSWCEYLKNENGNAE